MSFGKEKIFTIIIALLFIVVTYMVLLVGATHFSSSVENMAIIIRERFIFMYLFLLFYLFIFIICFHHNHGKVKVVKKTILYELFFISGRR